MHNPIFISLNSVEDVKNKSKKTINNIMAIFEDKSEIKNKIKTLKEKFPKISLEGMTSDKISKLHNMCFAAKEDVICESFDYEKDRNKMATYVNEKKLAGYRLFDSRVIDNKTAHVVMYK